MLNDSRVREFLVAMLSVWYLKKSVNMKCSQDIFPFFFFLFCWGEGVGEGAQFLCQCIGSVNPLLFLGCLLV